MGGSGLSRLMDALRAMPLPESVKGWDQVISVGFEDRPDLWYRWVIDGDRWSVLEGRAAEPTLRVVTTEAALVRCWMTGDPVGVRLLGPNAPGIIYKFTTLIVQDMAGYLRASAGSTLEELYATQLRSKYASPSDSVKRVLQTMGAAAVGAAVLGLLACWITSASSLMVGAVVATAVMVLALIVTTRNERTNYRKYHQEKIEVQSATLALVAAPAASVPVVAPAPVAAVAAPAWTPTHLVPAGGTAAWDVPDPSRPPVSELPANLELTREVNSGAWAQVKAAPGRESHMKVTQAGTIKSGGRVIAIDAVGGHLAIACKSIGEYRLFRFDDLSTYEGLGGDPASCNHMAFDRSGNFLAAAEGDPDYYIQGWVYDVTGRQHHGIRHGGPRRVEQGGRFGSTRVAFSPNARSLVLSSKWGESVCVDLHALMGDGSVHVLPLDQPSLGDASYAWSPDGRTIARVRGSCKRSVSLWLLKNGEDVQAADISQRSAEYRLGNGDDVGIGFPGLEFSPDSRWLAASAVIGKKGIVQIFDVQSNTLLCQSRTPRPEVGVLRFTPSGEFLVSGDKDGNLTCWKLQVEGTPELVAVESEKAPGAILAFGLALAKDGLFMAYKCGKDEVGFSHVSLPDGVS